MRAAVLLHTALFVAVVCGNAATHAPTTLSVVTWNLAERTPSKTDAKFLKQHLDSDLVVVGVQECEDIKPRRQEGRRSRAWRLLCRHTFGRTMRRVCSQKMEGMQISMFAKSSMSKNDVKIAGVTKVPCGIGNVLGNKGAVCIFAEIASRRLVFINAHLPAHQQNSAQRISAIARIMREVEANLPARWQKRGTLDAVDGVLFFGDLNSRLELPRLEAELAIRQLLDDGNNDWQPLLDYDQLQRQLMTGETLDGFSEPPIAFPPTFKYDIGSDRFDTSKKRRTPSWTDRILFKNRLGRSPSLQVTSYNAAVHVRHSDHRPVRARFTIH